MNRRDFIKAAVPSAALATWTVTCKYEEEHRDPKGHEGKKGETGVRWEYIVYCYERQQGEWIFSENVRGSFAPEREYMTFEEENDLTWNGYCGWMDGGKLHFTSLEEAQDFVEMHVRAKDDTNLVDSIYDIYYLDWDDPRLIDKPELNPTQIQVAHYWFNGDTGRQIQWQSKPPYTNFSKVEMS
tara:strand:- start:13087 stop:13638 length:552 start_codon:yes stop_codon:yes gene_type:complete